MSRYAAAHEKPDGPGDGRPTALQIIKDEGLEGKMTDKIFLVTGAAASIGTETARALAATGGKVYITARNPSKAAAAIKDFPAGSRVSILSMENSSLASVRACAAAFLAQESKLNVLVNNAGIMANPARVLTEDGFEEQFGVNYASHFLLFLLLRDALLKGAEEGFASRVVNVSSSGHHGGGIVFDDMTLGGEGAYSGWAAYGQSKTAMIYMTNEISRRYGGKGGKGIEGISLMPGGIKSNLQKHFDEEFKKTWDVDENIRPFMKDAGQGAATQVLAAVGKEYEGRGGLYLENCEEAKPGDGEGANRPGYAAHAWDQEKEERLWKVACGLVGEKDDR